MASAITLNEEMASSSDESHQISSNSEIVARKRFHCTIEEKRKNSNLTIRSRVFLIS